MLSELFKLIVNLVITLCTIPVYFITTIGGCLGAILALASIGIVLGGFLLFVLFVIALV
jgi:hypothetical protein